MRKPLILAAAAASIMAARPALALEPTGDWMVANGAAIIRIAQCGDRYWGVIAWEKEPGRDSNNPDASKRNRPTLGIPILLGMRAAQSNRWEGQVYNAENGQIHNVHIKLMSPDVLRIEGCLLFFCGGENWSRTKAPGGEPPRAQGRAGSKSAARPVDVCSAAQS